MPEEDTEFLTDWMKRNHPKRFPNWRPTSAAFSAAWSFVHTDLGYQTFLNSTLTTNFILRHKPGGRRNHRPGNHRQRRHTRPRVQVMLLRGEVYLWG
jgi:hypothetical protein